MYQFPKRRVFTQSELNTAIENTMYDLVKLRNLRNEYFPTETIAQQLHSQIVINVITSFQWLHNFLSGHHISDFTISAKAVLTLCIYIELHKIERSQGVVRKYTTENGSKINAGMIAKISAILTLPDKHMLDTWLQQRMS